MTLVHPQEISCNQYPLTLNTAVIKPQKCDPEENILDKHLPSYISRFVVSEDTFDVMNILVALRYKYCHLTHINPKSCMYFVARIDQTVIWIFILASLVVLYFLFAKTWQQQFKCINH